MLGFCTVARNTILLSTAQILNPLTSILLVSTIARMKGSEVLGQYSLVLAIFYMAVNLAGLGLNIPVTRSVAIQKDKASEFLIVCSAIGLASGFLAMVVVRILVFLLDYSPEIRSTCNLLMWAVFPSVLIFFYEAIFLAFHKAHHVAGISVAENVCKVAIGFILLVMGGSVFTLFFVILCLRFLACAAYLLMFRVSIGSIVPRFDWAVLRELRHVSPVFIANLLLGALLGRIDIILLSKFGTMSQVGLYSAALRLVQIARTVPNSLLRAGLPAMSEIGQMGTDGLKQLFLRSARYMIIYGFGAALGIFLFAGFLIRLFYGDGLMEAVAPLQILALMLIPVSLNPVLASLLFAANRQLLDFVANIAWGTLLLILCVLLIPRWGSTGAAIALVASNAILLWCLQAFVKKRIFQVNISPVFVWPLLAVALTLPISMVIRPVSPVLHAPIALVTYAIFIIILEPMVRKQFFSRVQVWRDGSRLFFSSKETSNKLH